MTILRTAATSNIRSVHTCCPLFREKPKNLKGKKLSSQLWLTRQLKDIYVEKAQKENYRCRSAFKLLEMNDRFHFLRPGQSCIDCGAAPGSWTQVAIKLTNSTGKEEDKAKGKVIAIDKLPIYPIEGATILGNTDFTNPESQLKVLKLLNGNEVDVVLSDMAPNASGIKELDHENIIVLAYSALKFALHVTKIGGTFLTKVWDGGKSQQFEAHITKFFDSLKIVRPDATRDESTEKFILARGFRGVKTLSNS